MEFSQLTQMVQWLDEERRKDKALIAALQEQVKLQAQQLAQQQELIAALQRTVAGMEMLLSQIPALNQALEGLKGEVGRMLELREEQWRKEQREAERARQLEGGALKDEIARVADGLRPIPRLEESLAALQAEARRLTENQQRLEMAIADLKKQTEDRIAAVVYLEEQRRADNKRITALEAELPELRRRIETTDSKLPLLEEAVQKQKRYLEEGLKPIKEFEKVVEELRVADFRRNQEVKKWAGQAEEVRAELERLREERQRLLEIHPQVRRALDALSALQTRLETRQNETAEMQRLAEERLERPWGGGEGGAGEAGRGEAPPQLGGLRRGALAPAGAGQRDVHQTAGSPDRHGETLLRSDRRHLGNPPGRRGAHLRSHPRGLRGPDRRDRPAPGRPEGTSAGGVGYPCTSSAPPDT